MAIAEAESMAFMLIDMPDQKRVLWVDVSRGIGKILDRCRLEERRGRAVAATWSVPAFQRIACSLAIRS
ncbi:MAG: hypothetical protein GX576_06200 [Thauera phenolivorans]|uniref:Uncharacterized protein n=1 Tax=Thauera phenolivorans TaxID=1792543 RepID=A0A7X7LVJ3_9RHOO|nr:hypothetical protein [Thauera phenolivorans]NLF53977.1 hypothetical protein [Thauera phenolivorans]